MIGEKPGGGYMVNCYFENAVQTKPRVTENVNTQRGQAQSRPSDLQTRFWSGRREQPVYGREREVHKPISGYGVNDAPISEGALSPRRIV